MTRIRTFENITYDLSQNIVKYDGKLMTNLKNQCLILWIGRKFKKVFRSGFSARAFTEFWVTPGELNPTRYKEWLRVEKSVKNALYYDLASVLCDSKVSYSYIKSMIQFMGLQIIEFIANKQLCHHVNISVYLKSLVFTCEGTINFSKTVIEVLTNYKRIRSIYFEIMCFHFINKNMRKYYRTNAYDLKYLDDGKNLAKAYFLYFWMWEVESSRPSIPNFLNIEPHKTKWLDRRTSDLDAYESIFLKAIEANNELAVEYLWVNKISKMEERDCILETALELIVENHDKNNIFIYLLCQVYETEAINFFIKWSVLIIKKIINDNRWHCVFMEIFYVLRKYIKDKHHLEIFRNLTTSHFQEYPEGMNLNLIVDYFHSLPFLIKFCITADSTPAPIDSNSPSTPNPYGRLLTKAFIYNSEDLLHKLLYVDISILKDFLKSEFGVISLTEAFKKGDFDFIYSGLEDFLKKDIKKFLKDVLKDKKYDLCSYFVENSYFDKLMKFTNVFFRCDQTFFELASEILYMYDGKFIIDTLFTPGQILDKGNLERATSVLTWCLFTDENVTWFKKNMNLVQNERKFNIIYIDRIKTCILNSQWEFLTDFFSWKGIGVDEKNALFAHLLNDDFIIRRLIRKPDSKDFVNNFIQFCVSHNVSVNYINNFKLKLLNRRRDLQSI